LGPELKNQLYMQLKAVKENIKNPKPEPKPESKPESKDKSKVKEVNWEALFSDKQSLENFVIRYLNNELPGIEIPFDDLVNLFKENVFAQGKEAGKELTKEEKESFGEIYNSSIRDELFTLLKSKVTDKTGQLGNMIDRCQKAIEANMSDSKVKKGGDQEALAEMNAAYLAFWTDAVKEGNISKMYNNPDLFKEKWERFQGQETAKALEKLVDNSGRVKDVAAAVSALENNPDLVITSGGKITFGSEKTKTQVERINQDAFTALGAMLKEKYGQEVDIDNPGSSLRVRSEWERDEDGRDVKSLKTVTITPTGSGSSQGVRNAGGTYRFRVKNGKLGYEKAIDEKAGTWGS